MTSHFRHYVPILAQCFVLSIISLIVPLPSLSFPKSCDELKRLGQQAEAFHDFQAAESFYREALSQAEHQTKRSHQVAETAARLAELYITDNQPAKAESLYKQALAIALEQKKSGTENQDVLVHMNDLSNAYEEKAHVFPVQFEQYMLHALQIRQTLFGVKHPLIGRSLEKLAGYYQAHGRLLDAEKVTKELICYWQEREEQKAGPNAGLYMTVLANLYIKEKKYRQSRVLAQQALAIFKTGDARANVLNLMGEIYLKEGKLLEAERMYKTALTMHEKLHGKRSLALALDLKGLSLIYRKTSRLNKAKQIESRVNSILASGDKVVRH